MQLPLPLFSGTLFVFLWIVSVQANISQEFSRFTQNETTLAERKDDQAILYEDIGNADFEDDDGLDEVINLTNQHDPAVVSVRHLHQKKGEIFVPCFGMWWPVGGGPVYDYVDYYGDYKKKRKRSRKQKKAAKMKKKKS